MQILRGSKAASARSIRRTGLALTVVLLLATRLVLPAAADNAPPITTVTSQTGAGFIAAGQVVWHGPTCPALARMLPDGGDSYACPPAVKLPQPPPSRPGALRRP